MSKWYIGTDTGSKVLAHYAKGASAKDHKWVSRSLRNGHWVYVYNDSKSGSTDSDDHFGVRLTDSTNESKQNGSSNKYKSEYDTHSGVRLTDSTNEPKQNASSNKYKSEYDTHSYTNSKNPPNLGRVQMETFARKSQAAWQRARDAERESRSPNLERVQRETAQRKSMNAQAENERNKVAEAKEDRERRSDQYWQERDWAIEGYYKLIESMTGKNIRDVSNFYDIDAKKTKNHQPGGKEPDAWATLTDKKTGKTFTVPSFEEYYQIAKKNKDASNKNAVNGIQQKYAEIQKSQKQKMLKDANNKNAVSSIQQKYGSLTKGNAPVSSSTSAYKPASSDKSKVISSKNGSSIKVRPATAADADLFKNKSSAETKKKVTISDHGGNTGIKTEVTKKKKRRL